MKIVYIKLVLVAFVLLAGCTKILDLQPSQSINEELSLVSETNVKSVLRGAYSQFASDAIYGGNLLRNSELLAAGDEILWVGTYGGPRQIFNKAIKAANEDVRDQWMDSYLVINSANNVLSALDVVGDDDRDMVEGEALFLRAFAYFDLARFFGDQYQPGIQNNQLAVPLVLLPTRGGITSVNSVGRSTVQQVYDQVVADLILAASKLPEENDVYASSGSANALLARVYLQQGDYANARDAADDVIGSQIYQLRPKYADVFNNDNNSSEDIFAVQITPQDRFSAMTEFFSIPIYGGRDGDIEILDGHMDLYDPTDDRYEFFYYGYGAMRSGKWNNQYGVVNQIRLAEMYLIRAECNFRLSATVGADPLDDFNEIHTRAGLLEVGSITLDDILLERRLELSFEGFRIHDIKRLHEMVGSLEYDDARLLFPIPAREIEANPTLKTQQNPGY